MPAPTRRFSWSRSRDERLLQIRMKDLGVTLEGTWLERMVAELYDELEARGLRFRPHVWIGDEWFSPTGVPGFAVPFYLTHPRLQRLERSQMREVEGATRAECLRIMRHETGHAIQHAYRLNLRRRWQQLFGKSSTTYPDYYRPNPGSRRYVQHLRLWYAQSHPDEDFAETFAVWLRPRSDWRRRYVGWPALKKLQYVDQLMSEICDVPPPVRTRRFDEPVRLLRKRLSEHYAERRAHYTVDLPNTYDRDLERIFSRSPWNTKWETASSFLRRNRGEIRRTVSKWTGEYQYTLDVVLGEMIGRCRQLRLRAVGPERQLINDFCVLLTVTTMHYLYAMGRRKWIAL
jgi:hypothetical protein